MWTCPNCGREFKNTGQNHYCGKPPETIAAYISSQPEHTQARLQQVYLTIKELLPNAVEKILWGMPTFWEGRNLIHFAAGKEHIGLYPGTEALQVFADRLDGFKTTKGGIQLPNDEDLPLELIRDVTRWCYQASKPN